MFFTEITSPSVTSILPSCSNRDKTPVSLKTTFLSKSPSSYPKYVISDLTFCIGLMVTAIPVQFKNWFTVLSVYVIVLLPDIIVPAVVKPTVESTVSTLELGSTFSNAFELGMIIKSP